MIVSLIVAMGSNRVIGRDNQMMWHLPLEFKYFKEKTLNHCIVTGRKNFEAMGRALPKRTNIIVTRQDGLTIEGAEVVNSIEEAIQLAKDQGETEVFICGGGQIYKEAIIKNLVDKMYITQVDYKEDGDIYFPDFNEDDFNKISVLQTPVSENNNYAWEAFIFERK